LTMGEVERGHSAEHLPGTRQARVEHVAST
jgi:hypothetical protein